MFTWFHICPALVTSLHMSAHSALRLQWWARWPLKRCQPVPKSWDRPLRLTSFDASYCQFTIGCCMVSFPQDACGILNRYAGSKKAKKGSSLNSKPNTSADLTNLNQWLESIWKLGIDLIWQSASNPCALGLRSWHKKCRLLWLCPE